MQKKILLVDDDKDDRDFFIDAVGAVSDAIAITALESGITLLQDLDNGKIPMPDLIVLDINIPQFDGWMCLSELKKSLLYQHLPVIMYSTSSSLLTADKAKDAGAVCFFSKPFNYKEYKEIIKELYQHLEQGNLDELPKNSKYFF
ncbi:response regulator [Flavobacterium foetidum]|uniref:response regulator n=1 Tax=Flavobacterium foetidum TaxID=2026681 RepID=UPI001074BC19|nr:response regulator [Flavobacterium foetidum]KAF2514865.1 response regulator [Flavobacterium foetidum]